MTLRTGLMPFFQEHCYPLYFVRQLSEELVAENKALNRLARVHRLERLKKSHFKKVPKDTAFILGTGGSINTYTDLHWNRIRQGFSIGVNFWLLHDFVPDAYSMEVDDRSTEAIVLEREVHYGLLELRQHDYKQTIMMTRGRNTFDFLRQHPMPAPLDARLKLALSLSFRGDKPEDRLRYALGFSTLLGWNRRFRPFPFLLTPGIDATILFLTLLSYELGFEAVVLCGVDLNRSQHFYETPLAESRMVKEDWPVPPTLENQKAAAVHPTFDRQRMGGLNVQDYLRSIYQERLNSRGFRIFSGSPLSALVSDFPVYPW
jgi:hypothetical protein